jgi:predicted membrane protein
MFPSACSFIVFRFSLILNTCFGLHGHHQVCRILHIFIFIRLKDSASLPFFFLTWSYPAYFPFVFCSCAIFLLYFCCFLVCVCVCVCVFVRTQGNNKNNERKEHRNKTQMENMQSRTMWRKKKGSEAESFKHVKINMWRIIHTWKWHVGRNM